MISIAAQDFTYQRKIRTLNIIDHIHYYILLHNWDEWRLYILQAQIKTLQSIRSKSYKPPDAGHNPRKVLTALYFASIFFLNCCASKHSIFVKYPLFFWRIKYLPLASAHISSKSCGWVGRKKEDISLFPWMSHFLIQGWWQSYCCAALICLDSRCSQSWTFQNWWYVAAWWPFHWSPPATRNGSVQVQVVKFIYSRVTRS